MTRGGLDRRRPEDRLVLVGSLWGCPVFCYRLAGSAFCQDERVVSGTEGSGHGVGGKDWERGEGKVGPGEYWLREGVHRGWVHDQAGQELRAGGHQELLFAVEVGFGRLLLDSGVPLAGHGFAVGFHFLHLHL